MKQSHLLALFILLTISLTIGGFSVNASATPVVVWSNTFDYGSYSFDDGFSVLEITTGVQRGNYLVVGTSNNYGIYVVMVNSQTGAKIWDRTYGGEFGGTAIEDGLGNFLISAATEVTASTGRDHAILMIDSAGNVVDFDSYPSETAFGDHEYALDIVKGANGGYLLVGYYFGCGMGVITKVDNNRNLVWQKVLDSFNCTRSVVAKADGYVLVGESYLANKTEMTIGKIDLNGNRLWTVVHDIGTGSSYAYSGTAAHYNGYVMAGFSYFDNGSGGGQADCTFVGTTANGQLVGKGNYGGPGDQYCFSIIRDTDGYVAAGDTGYAQDAYLVKIDNSGNFVWDLKIHEAYPTELQKVILTSDGYYVAAGTAFTYVNNSERDFYLVKLANPPAPPVCGNSLLETNEECDDGNTFSGDGCNAVCVIEFCGDGIVNNNGTEQCDDGNTNNNDGCDINCHIPEPTPGTWGGKLRRGNLEH